MSSSLINIGKDFSRYPVGRYRADGESNGEAFREDFLRPKLTLGRVILEMDDAFGYGSSFLEEVFGGLIRGGFTPSQVEEKIDFMTADQSLVIEIKSYMADAERVKLGR